MKKIGRVWVSLVVIAFPVLYTGSEAMALNKATEEKERGSNEVAQVNSWAPSVKVLERWELPGILVEVSGIGYLGNGRFACIQDELGTIFIYNTTTASIEKEIPFGGPGDFEGIAIHGSTAYAVQSDGKIFEVRDYLGAKPEVKQYATFLTARHNVEGFTFDKDNNRLLLAIKGEEPGSPAYKGIYAFDLATGRLAPDPVIKINLADPAFGEGKGKKMSKAFQPSEIAIHPLTKELYLLEGVNPRLLVMNADGSIRKMHVLERSSFPQAEGLSFSPQGELFISNEGRGGAATILRVGIDQ